MIGSKLAIYDRFTTFKTVFFCHKTAASDEPEIGPINGTSLIRIRNKISMTWRLLGLVSNRTAPCPKESGRKKCARNVCSGRIAFFVVSATTDQADIAFTRAERRETLREPVFL